MNILQAGIEGLVVLMGKGDIFDRIVHQIEKIEKNIGAQSGAYKKDILLKELKIIGIGISGMILNALIELGCLYIKGITPASAAPVVDRIGDGIQDKIEDVIDDLENIQS